MSTEVQTRGINGPIKSSDVRHKFYKNDCDMQQTETQCYQAAQHLNKVILRLKKLSIFHCETSKNPSEFQHAHGLPSMWFHSRILKSTNIGKSRRNIIILSIPCDGLT